MKELLKNLVINSLKIGDSSALDIEKNAIQVGNGLSDMELKLLSEATKYDRFFFVVDILDQSIRLSNGIKQWLGYTDEEFTFNLYTSLIHNHHKDAVMLFSKTIFEATIKKENSCFIERYVAEIAIKHAKGHYLLVKHIMTWCDFDKIYNMPIAYLNEFVIWGEYDSESLVGIKPRIIDLYGARMLDLENISRENAYKILESEKYFSTQELRILRKYAYNINFTTQDISLAFKISHNTTNIYNRRIIEKSLHLYPNIKLKTAKEIAQFLRKENFI